MFFVYQKGLQLRIERLKPKGTRCRITSQRRQVENDEKGGDGQADEKQDPYKHLQIKTVDILNNHLCRKGF